MTFLRSLHLHLAQGLVRHGYPWVPPPTRLTAVPNKWVRPTRRPADLLVGPTDLVGSPHDLLKTFQKIPQTRRQLDMQDKAVQTD
jgi:hypothetical protein